MGILCTLFGHLRDARVLTIDTSAIAGPVATHGIVYRRCARCKENYSLGMLARPPAWEAPATHLTSGHELTLEHFDSDGTTKTIKVCGGTPSPVDGVVGDKVIFKPWYPDDSGEWVEIPHFRELMRLPLDTTLEVLSLLERQRKQYIREVFVAGELDLHVSLSAIVAVKIIKYPLQGHSARKTSHA